MPLNKETKPTKPPDAFYIIVRTPILERDLTPLRKMQLVFSNNVDGASNGINIFLFHYGTDKYLPKNVIIVDRYIYFI